MIKGIVITIIVMIGLIDYALVVACSRLEDKESYEAYERWKESRKNGRSDLIWYGDKTDLIGDETGRHTGWFGKGADDE